MPEEHYRRRQSPLWFTLTVVALVGSVALIGFVSGLNFYLWLVGAFAVFLVVLFWGLTVTVTDESIELSFGVGLISRAIPRSTIVRANAVRNRWWYGFGIRAIPNGWMWNISGLDAVELEYEDGKHFRVGTADPVGLLAALGFPADEGPDATPGSENPA